MILAGSQKKLTRSRQTGRSILTRGLPGKNTTLASWVLFCMTLFDCQPVTGWVIFYFQRTKRSEDYFSIHFVSKVAIEQLCIYPSAVLTSVLWPLSCKPLGNIFHHIRYFTSLYNAKHSSASLFGSLMQIRDWNANCMVANKALQNKTRSRLEEVHSCPMLDCLVGKVYPCLFNKIHKTESIVLYVKSSQVWKE